MSDKTVFGDPTIWSRLWRRRFHLAHHLGLTTQPNGEGTCIRPGLDGSRWCTPWGWWLSIKGWGSLPPTENQLRFQAECERRGQTKPALPPRTFAGTYLLSLRVFWRMLRTVLFGDSRYT